MSAFSDYLETTLGTLLLKGGAYTSGAVYLALFTSAPSDAGGGVECSYVGYARQQAHTTVVSDGFNASAGTFTNAKSVSFPAVAGATITVTHWALFSAVSAGNLLFHAPLTNSKTLDVNDVLNFPISSISITLA